MNNNMNTQPVKQLSEKAREGRRRRQTERRRRRRQRERVQCNNEYDLDDFDDYNCYEFCELSKFMVIDPKFDFLKKVDTSELNTKLAQIYSEHNKIKYTNSLGELQNEF